MKKLLPYKSLWVFLFFISHFLSAQFIAVQAQLTVTNTDDSGAGSLRQAIADANFNLGADEIVFDESLDGMTITLNSALTITGTNAGETTINGDIDGDGTPDIILEAGGTGYSALEVEADNCIIKGLNIYGFLSTGQAAILVDGADGTTILSCYLGTNMTGNSIGTVDDNHSGIYLNNGATNTQIGNGTSSSMNIIGGNSFGIRIAGSSNNTIISGNRIGLGVDGSTEISNSRGIDIFSSSGTQIGVGGELENFISASNNEGIRVNTSPNTTIVNNRIGVNATGLLERGNGAQGIYFLNESDGGQVGGTDPGSRNIICGNSGSGIDIDDSDNITVLNNYIGLGIDGTTAIGNGTSGPAGIRVQGTSADTQIGDGTAAGRNIISAGVGVGSAGILINSGPTYVHGNYIGTNAAGNAAVGNAGAGIVLATNGSGQIGGTTSGQGNVISGNNYGIGVSVGGFQILGNYIGTNADGTAALANLNQGIRLSVGSSTQIGDGTLAGANIISGNTSHGLLIENASTTNNTINYNLIGVGADEETAIPNGANGILLESDANSNTISQNLIANNTENGIEIGEVSSSGIEYNTITENSIYSNEGEGILITNDAQEGILPPTITSTLNGQITGTSGANATIEIFADAEDEGEQYLATTTADGSGNWNYQVTISAIDSGLSNISATQTDANGNTSEFSSAALVMSSPFITTWKTDNPGASESNQITIPTIGTGYDYIVYWEDVSDAENNNGGTEIGFNDTNTPHTITFPTAGTYRVEISGNFPRIFFNNVGDKEKILTVEQWAGIAWTSMVSAFYGCANLNVTATDAPDLSGVESTFRMFHSASSLNADFSGWDVSNVTNFGSMFFGAASFNSNIGGWNVSNATFMASMFDGTASFNQDLSGWIVNQVTNMAFMFNGATAFNSDISSWDVSDVKFMNGMFRNATSFNQDISEWVVSSVTTMSEMFSNATNFNVNISDWNVGVVTDMASMFSNATAFNQDISGWDVSSVEQMNGMFSNAPAFNQNLGAWDISSITNMSSMLSNSGLSTVNYDATLIGWADDNGGTETIPTGPSLTLGADGLTYSCTASAARLLLTGTYTWNINDAGETADETAPIPDAAELADIEVQCEVTSLTAPTATDDCSGSVTGTTDAVFPITASTTITWTYTDNAGHFITQDQNIVVDDTIGPEPDTETLADVIGECQVELAGLTAPTATDNCDNGSITGTTDEGQFPITTSMTITWTFTDSQGNVTEQAQNIVVEDNSVPVTDNATLENVTAQCSIDLTDLTIPTATDNCLGSVEGTTETTFPVTASQTITWTFTDEAGNQSTQDQEVIIEDTTSPVVDVETLEAITSECQVTVLTAPTASDNCSGQLIGTHNANLPLTWSTTITWTYTDASGNETTQTQNVVIEDITPPVADQTMLDAVTAECSLASLLAPTATDNCDGMITGIHDASLPITESQTITWTFTDVAGNSSTQAQNIEIEDTTPPEPNLEFLDEVMAQCATVTLFAPTATDNCSGSVTATTDTEFPLSSSQAVTWTYVDETGNESTQVQKVTIECDALGFAGEEAQWIVYPNPVRDILKIDMGNSREISLRILDAAGKVVHVQKTRDQVTSIDIDAFPPGIYFISVKDGTTERKEKFVKQ